MVTIAVFVFITMAIILAASAINNIANLIQSMSELEEEQCHPTLRRCILESLIRQK